MAIINLLFNDDFYQILLSEQQKNFCDLYDGYVKDNKPTCQALAILGLALISAYQGDLTSSYAGLNQATKLYSPLNKLVKAIEYCLPSINDMTIKEDFLMKNLLSKFKMYREKVAIVNFRIK